jgi:hypothetical protein
VEISRPTLSQEEEGKADQPRKILLRKPDEVAPFRLGSSSLAGPGPEMHHLKHLWHTVQMLPMYMSIREKGGGQLLWKNQLVNPRVDRLRHISSVSQIKFPNVDKVLFLVAHDYKSREHSSNQI